MTALAQDLATAINGTVRDNSILVPTATGIRVIRCRPTGRVYLDRTFQLGTISDGVEHLAAMYQAAVGDVAC